YKYINKSKKLTKLWPNNLVYSNEEKTEKLNFPSKKFKLNSSEINKLKQFYFTELNIPKSRIK
ncbi:15965_t:CDS:1, partial [Racocetra fulgida]